MLRSEIILNVRSKLQIKEVSNDTPNNTDISHAIDDAVIQFSRDIPAEATQEYKGESEAAYPLPTDWDNLSQMENIFFRPYSFPYDKQNYIVDDKTDETPRACSTITSGATSVTLSTPSDAGYFLDGDVIMLVNDNQNVQQNWVSADGNTTTGVVALKNAASATYNLSPKIKKQPQLLFLRVTPSPSDFFKVNFTKSHVVSDDETINTIPTKYQDAFEYLVAALTAFQLAAKYANSQDPTIPADIDFGGKSAEWREVANDCLKIYQGNLKIGESVNVGAASSLLNLNLNYNAPGMNVLYPA